MGEGYLIHCIGSLLLLLCLHKWLFRDVLLCLIIAFLTGIAIELSQIVFEWGIFDYRDILSNIFGLFLGFIYLMNKK